MKAALDLSGSADTIVGESVVLSGELRSPGNVVIDGTVTGDVTAAGDVTIGQTGSLSGDLQAQNVQIAGRVRGDIRAGEKCELRYSSELSGDIICQILEVHPGARFQGQVSMRESEADPGESAPEEPAEA